MNGIARILAGGAIVGVLGVAALPASSQTLAPTPVPVHRPASGAGLPVLAAGFGVYWLIRRRRKVE
jgi:MYXO-CTERM domain-containing protein